MKDTATKTEKAEHTEKTDSDANLKDSTQEVPKPQTILPFVDSLDNLEKFQDIVGDIMKRALQENNVELENRIADSVLKEMEILMKIQEKERKNVTEIWMKPFAPFSITGRWWQRQERRRAIKNGFGFLNKKKIEKQGELLTQLPCFYKIFNYSPATIAPVGHSPSHVPQSRHASASITYLPSPSLIASAGQASAHVPQATHSSVITYAMIKPPYFYEICFQQDSALRIFIPF